jgi:hypothetical protein
MRPPFEDWVDSEGLEPGEEERLRRLHELLLEVGEPPELPASLRRLPADFGGARVLAFPRRRIAAGLVLAATIAGAAFGGGYLAGHGGGFSARRVVAMSGGNALASVGVGAPDTAGNWPIRFRVSGLPKSSGKYSYYELFVLRNGKPGFPCGGFRVDAAGTTTATFSVPYKVDSSTRWVLTSVDKTHHWPGRTVMT